MRHLFFWLLRMPLYDYTWVAMPKCKQNAKMGNYFLGETWFGGLKGRVFAKVAYIRINDAVKS